MADWSALPHTAVALVARRLQLIEDFIAFRRTCSSWWAATSLKDFDRSCPRLPLLMLDLPYVFENRNKDVEEREFFSLSKSKTCKISLPETRGMVHCSGSKGWLIIMLGYEDDMSLLHPITRVQIPLPTHPKHCYPFKTAVLSASPSETSEYALMITGKASGMNPETLSYMGFWKPGDIIWTQVEIPKCSFWVDDVNYYNGKFYALTSPSQILMYDILGPNPKKATKIIDLPWHLKRPHASLVECTGRFVVVAPYYTYHYDCSHFDDLAMVELDVIKGTYTNITTLGNSAVFLGYDDGGFSIDATRFPGVLEPNYIYFNDGHYQPAICGSKTLKLTLSGIKRKSSCIWVNF